MDNPDTIDYALFKKREGECFSKNYLSLVPKDREHDNYFKVVQHLQFLGLIPKEFKFSNRKEPSLGNLIVSNHDLLNKKVKNKEGQIGFVQQVNLQHYEGWYIALLLNFNGSHVCPPYINISSSAMDSTIASSRKIYQIID